MVSVIALCVTISGVLVAVGRFVASQKSIESVLSRISDKMDAYDKRMDKMSNFMVRVDQRVMNLETRVIGENNSARERESDV
ncbi:hypothetical protein V2H45_05905 [Tumidithrix elongata RA019]|uniref:Uncharacterized protein n=1 Tax=Tumidithrix elongata BACA0141 TaxID=2716417 RepID=A0AAW9PYG7_9CYAN|nr:hypothetical protein [Tumidithrix elongata RA019]